MIISKRSRYGVKYFVAAIEKETQLDIANTPLNRKERKIITGDELFIRRGK